MSYPEPNDVGPAAGGHLPVSENDRTKVVTLLESAFAEGRITAEEHTERMDAAAAAQTFDDLVPLTRDLVVLDRTAPATRAWGQAPGLAGAEPELIVTLFGATQLDLREAVFTDNVCEVNVFCLFGAVEVLVPEGCEVQNHALAIFGASSAKGTPPVPGAPTVILRGFVGFGAAEAHTKKWKGQNQKK